MEVLGNKEKAFLNLKEKVSNLKGKVAKLKNNFFEKSKNKDKILIEKEIFYKENIFNLQDKISKLEKDIFSLKTQNNFKENTISKLKEKIENCLLNEDNLNLENKELKKINFQNEEKLIWKFSIKNKIYFINFLFF